MGGLGLGLQLQLQMSWQPSLLSQKRQTGPPLGLKNLGNSCYLNSVLQCLTYTPPLANFCLRFQHSSLCDSTNGERKRECPFCILEKRIVRSLSIDLTLDAPAKIQRCLRIFAEHFRCGRQEDAHEFLRYVIDACHNTCLRLKKLHCSKGNDSTNGNYSGSGSTVVKEIFGGALQSQVKCLSCNCESNKVDDIMDISLDILQSNSVRDAMQKFFQPEILAGNNKYKCEKCKKLVEARKQMSILQAPNILVIQLKRFEGIFGGKIDKAITFEEFLVLSSFMCKVSQDPQPEYKLFGTIVHSGYSPESGHYYAYIKDAMGRWYCCNDSYVTLSTLQEVLSEKVYILFFCRANQKPVSGITTFTSNGVKSREFNENESSETPKRSVPVKSVLTKPYAEQPSREDISSLSKIDNVPSNPRVKFNILGNGSKRSVPVKSVLTKPYAEQPSREDISSLSKIDNVPSNPRVKFNILGNGSKRAASTVDRSADACKIQKQEANGSAKDSVHGDKIDKNTLSTRNSLDNNKEVGAVNGDRCQKFAAGSENGYNQNGTLHGVRPLSENNGSLCTMKTERPYHTERENYVNGHSNLPGCKRKLNRDSCILFAQDAQSEAKIEELKENLNKEALSVLRSCGWYEIVYRFMHSQKRLCAGECRNKPSGNTFKKSLIAEAKLKFIPQIPEALELDLLKHLQSFSTEK